jgi:hypothetical protein
VCFDRHVHSKCLKSCGGLSRHDSLPVPDQRSSRKSHRGQLFSGCAIARRCFSRLVAGQNATHYTIGPQAARFLWLAGFWGVWWLSKAAYCVKATVSRIKTSLLFQIWLQKGEGIQFQTKVLTGSCVSQHDRLNSPTWFEWEGVGVEGGFRRMEGRLLT